MSSQSLLFMGAKEPECMQEASHEPNEHSNKPWQTHIYIMSLFFSFFLCSFFLPSFGMFLPFFPLHNSSVRGSVYIPEAVFMFLLCTLWYAFLRQSGIGYNGYHCLHVYPVLSLPICIHGERRARVGGGGVVWC